MSLNKILDEFHEWMAVNFPKPHPDNKLFIPSKILIAIGLDEYTNRFVHFYDNQPHTELSFDREEVLTAFTRFANMIHGMNIKHNLYVDPTGKSSIVRRVSGRPTNELTSKGNAK